MRDIVAELVDKAALEWIIEEFNLDLGLVFLRQSSIEKRLKGIRWIKRALLLVPAKEKKSCVVCGALALNRVWQVFGWRVCAARADWRHGRRGGRRGARCVGLRVGSAPELVRVAAQEKKLIPAENVVKWLETNDVLSLLATFVDYPELIKQGQPNCVARAHHRRLFPQACRCLCLWPSEHRPNWTPRECARCGTEQQANIKYEHSNRCCD